MSSAGNWKSLFHCAKSFSYGLIVGLPVYITFADHGYCVARVDGISMQPNLNPVAKRSDVVLLSRWAAKNFNSVERGEVISLISPQDPDTKLIKRVIGLEGDIIKTLGYKTPTVRIPRGHCWVEGDNHEHSLDSNSFGPISMGLINGRASYILWPPSRFQKLKRVIAANRHPVDRLMPTFELDDDVDDDHCYEDQTLGNNTDVDAKGLNNPSIQIT